MNNKLKILVSVIFIMVFQISYAEEQDLEYCGDAFSNALQTHSLDPADNIVFACTARIVTSNVVLNGLNVNNPGGNCATSTCSSANCISSGTVANSIDAGSFKYSDLSTGNFTVEDASEATITPDSAVLQLDTVTVGTNATINFGYVGLNTTYIIKEFVINNGATINMEPGEYWIENLQQGNIDRDVTLNVIGNGTVRIFLQDSITIRKEAKLNLSGNSSNLFIYGYDNILIEESVNIKAFIYSQKSINLRKNSFVTGALNAENIDLNLGAVVTYEQNNGDLRFGALCPSASLASYYTLSHDNYGVYCIEEEVTVTAMNNLGVSENYTGSVLLDIDVGVGTWSLLEGNGSLAGNIYDFDISDNGVVKLGLTYTSGTNTLNINAHEQYDMTITDDDTEGDLYFDIAGYLLQANNVDAGASQTIGLTAYGVNDGTCGVITSYSGAMDLNFWSEYINPTSGTIQFTVDSVSVGTDESSSVNQVVNFMDGQASVAVKYRDVGQVKLYVKETYTPSSVARGSTQAFVVKPAQFEIVVPDNPGATNANGNVFTSAGENFTVNILPKDLDGNLTPNYGNEKSPESVMLTSSIVGPSGGFGSISYGNFIKDGSNQQVSTNVRFDEVGIIKLTASVADGDYLGAGNTSGPESPSIGRFVPYDFQVTVNSTPEFISECSANGFTYLDQNFSFAVEPDISIIAVNKNNQKTANYTGDYFKISSMSMAPVYTSNSPVATLNSLNAETDITITEISPGDGHIIYGDGGGITFEKIANTNIAPFSAQINMQINIQDDDNVRYSANPVEFNSIIFQGGDVFYQGRMILNNNFGSEFVILNIPYTVEYYDGSAYVTNNIDSCTQLLDNDVLLSSDPDTMSSIATVIPITGGIGSITLSKPTPHGSSGYIDLEIDLSPSGANLPFLRHDWPYDNNSDGVYDDNPRARATFGIYDGEQAIIYIKEEK